MRFLIFLFVTLGAAHSEAASDKVSDEKLFEFCSPIPVMKLEVFVQETGEPRILDEESIRNAVELKMRQADVFTNDEATIVPSLKASVIKHNEAYSVRLEYRRLLRGLIAEEQWRKTAVWGVSQVGTTSRPEKIMSSVINQTDSFFSEFFFVQESSECAEWKAKG